MMLSSSLRVGASPLCSTKSVPSRWRHEGLSARQFTVTRAVEEKAETPPTTLPATYFYAGKSYTEEEWKAAKAAGTVGLPAPSEPRARNPFVDDEPQGLGRLMAFDGPAPELINGRLAMLAVLAALASEAATGESVVRQWASEPVAISLTVITFAVASLIPMLQTTKREPFAFFTPKAEMLNGRLAMLGFASLLAIEAARGSALL